MRRRWADLRLMIDHRMKQQGSTPGPFAINEAIHLMFNIAEDMDTLHIKHDILHRNLKASNVLVWIGSGEVTSFIPVSNRVEKVGSIVADFECSVGVLGTGFWRALEILEQLKDKVPTSEVQFTRASDVYSYGMICYEVVTGCIPYDGLGGIDITSQVLQGRRPELPHELPEFVKNIIVGCWHSDPSERPTFLAICMALKLKRSPTDPVTFVIDNKTLRGASIVKVEQWNIPQALTLFEVMQKLMDMHLSVLNTSDSSSTEMITQYFKVTNCKGRKVEDDKSFANITKCDITMALSLRVLDECPDEWKWVNQSLKIPIVENIDGNTIVQMHVVEVVAKRSAGLLRNFSRLLVATNFQVHSAGCQSREDRVEYVIYVEGARMITLLWELQRNMECFRISTQCVKLIVHRVAAEEFSHLNTRLHNLKSMDLTQPWSSSNIRVHQELWDDFPSTEVVVCLRKSELLVHVSGSLADMNYKIFGANIKYPGPYKFLKGRANKYKDIGDEEMGNMKKILDVAIEHGCPEVNGQLIVSGPSKVLHLDLMRSLHDNGLVVTGGQVFLYSSSSDYSNLTGNLELFVTENLAAGAG